MSVPDASVLDLHRVDGGPVPVRSVHGEAWRAPEDSEDFSPLRAGEEVALGETVAVAAGGVVELPGLTLRGGNRGRAHALVSQGSFRSSPGRADVPRLVAQLEQIEKEMPPIGDDPLTMQSGPITPTERAQSAEFARLNFDPEAAQLLGEAAAREAQAVCLFVSDETAFVAVRELTVPKLRSLIEGLGRPVSPHVVADEVLDELLERAYGAV